MHPIGPGHTGIRHKLISLKTEIFLPLYWGGAYNICAHVEAKDQYPMFPSIAIQ